METTTHHWWAKIAIEKRSLFRPHRGLAAPNLFLDTVQNMRTWEACPIDCMKALGNIYGNRSQICRPKGKTYKDAQLGELAQSIPSHLKERTRRGEASRRWSYCWTPANSNPKMWGCTSPRGWQLGVVEAMLQEKPIAPPPNTPNVKVVLRHFHWHYPRAAWCGSLL
jgi:hypothetical protein